MTTTIIAGGTGVIGRAIAQDLVANGHEVIVLSRNPDKHADLLSHGLTLVQWQTDKIGDWATTIDGADIVINFAGENLAGDGFLPDRWNDSKKKRLRQSRLAAGNAINEAIRLAAHRPRVLVQSSAVGYYGPRENEMITESNRPGTDFLANICVDWEATTAPVEELGVRRVITRTGLMLSPYSGPLQRIKVRFQLFAGGPFGSGDQYWSWVHLKDIVQAIRFLIDEDSANGPFNLTSPNPVTNREFAKVLGRVMNRPSFVPLPAFAMKMLVGEVSTVVLDGQRALPQKLKELGFVFSFSDLEATLIDLLKN